MGVSSFEDVSVSPVTVGDSINKKNVISKTFVCPNDKIGEAFNTFITEIVNAGQTLVGLPFFIMDTNLESGWSKVKLHISIKHSNPQLPERMHFDSYFSVSGMASLCVIRDPEQNISQAYVQLLDYLKENALTQITPIFQVLGGDKNNQYTFLKVGYREE